MENGDERAKYQTHEVLQSCIKTHSGKTERTSCGGITSEMCYILIQQTGWSKGNALDSY
jgi:hypothetical protein